MKSSEYVLVASFLAIAQPAIAEPTETMMNRSETRPTNVSLVVDSRASQECDALIFIATHMQKVPKGQSKTGANIAD